VVLVGDARACAAADRRAGPPHGLRDASDIIDILPEALDARTIRVRPGAWHGCERARWAISAAARWSSDLATARCSAISCRRDGARLGIT